MDVGLFFTGPWRARYPQLCRWVDTAAGWVVTRGSDTAGNEAAARAACASGARVGLPDPFAGAIDWRGRKMPDCISAMSFATTVSNQAASR